MGFFKIKKSSSLITDDGVVEKKDVMGPLVIVVSMILMAALIVLGILALTLS